MTIPNLQAQIERRAQNKIIEEIQRISEKLKYTEKPAIIEGVQVKITDATGEKFVCPYLCQIYDCASVRNAIIEHNLPIYIQREIDALLTKG